MRSSFALWIPAFAGMTLAACGGNDGGSVMPIPPGSTPTPGAALCVSSSCGSKTVLLDIPSAENILFTDTGRLFVSGSQNVYEITRPGGTWTATPISPGGSFGGMAQVGDVLYANSFGDGSLWAARLTEAPTLAPIHDLGLASPNGMTAGPDGELYIVNGPIPQTSLPDPKIVRVKLDADDPLHVAEQTDWLAFPFGDFPNGVQRIGRTLYVTFSAVGSVTVGGVRAVGIEPGGAPGEAATVGTFLSLPDDLGIAGDELLVTYYSNGEIARMALDGTIVESTGLLSFDNPSSVRLGRPPLFATNELVVTEKGVVGLPPTPGYGNVLSVFTPDP